MAVKNNYWKVVSKEERHYYAYPGGWEIPIRKDTYFQKGEEKEKMYVCIPKDCPREARADFRKKLARDKRIAQSVTTREEYLALWKRIDDENWDYIESNDLKDGDLIYWAYNTRTADEYYRLLRFN